MSIYKQSAHIFMGSLVAAFMLAGLTTNPAMGQEKAKAVSATAEKGKATTKVLVDNDKVLVVETRYRPGDVAADDRSSYRVNRTLQGGTLLRIYPDGKQPSFPLSCPRTRRFRFL